MLLPAIVVALSLGQPPAHQPFDFQDGDRVVWIGNTLAEREQRHGYWETLLHLHNAKKQFTFRNLGWSGDTVFGDARAGFDNAAKGFERLISLTLELKPTVILVSYGTNESFEGKEGLPAFEKGLEKLLDALAPTKARFVLMTPIPFEKATGVPDPASRNQMLALYRDAIRSIARKRNHDFVDLFERISQAGLSAEMAPLTDNGLHLSDSGYQVTASYLLDDKPSIGKNGMHGVEQDALRKAIIEKNQLFFYRWRPQNETYLFGFRKHEQGKNAKEVVEFDPLIARAEEAIQKQLQAITK
jgi:lysophospholipase L1-like esterase